MNLQVARPKLAKAIAMQKDGHSYQSIIDETGVGYHAIKYATDPNYKEQLRAARKRNEEERRINPNKYEYGSKVIYDEKNPDIVYRRMAVVSDRSFFPIYVLVSLPRLKWLERPNVWEGENW